jgi:hypothetical protein
MPAIDIAPPQSAGAMPAIDIAPPQSAGAMPAMDHGMFNFDPESIISRFS